MVLEAKAVPNETSKQLLPSRARFPSLLRCSALVVSTLLAAPTDSMDRTDPARGRLAVLSSHLPGAAVEGADSAAALERSQVSAAPPGTRAGVLAVVDTRTGKRYEVKVSEDGTVRATDFKKVTSSPL